MTDTCPLCRAKPEELEPVYVPDGTLRGLTVYVCRRCGMTQSLPRDKDGDGLPRPTAKAAFGNMRLGKRLRAVPNLAFIGDALPDFRPATLLDVGASRGDFCRLALARWPDLKATAVEPDARLTPPPDLEARVDWYAAGIEGVGFDARFDLAYCSHTLEHLPDPLAALEKLAELVEPTTGWLLVEVPNLYFITAEDVLAEWFIDKHLNHFSEVTLRAMLHAAGWRVVHTLLSLEYVTVLAARAGRLPVRFTNEPYLSRSMVGRYRLTRQANLERLPELAAAWNALAERKRVVCWGAGRIYWALRQAGLSAKISVVDSWADGVLRPGDVEPPEVVLAASREYGGEIEEQAGKLWPKCDIIRWDKIKGDK